MRARETPRSIQAYNLSQTLYILNLYSLNFVGAGSRPKRVRRSGTFTHRDTQNRKGANVSHELAANSSVDQSEDVPAIPVIHSAIFGGNIHKDNAKWGIRST